MAKLTIPIAVNLTRTGLSLCTPHSPQPLALNFPPAVAKDMEVINQSELNTLIRTFVTTHQLRPAHIILVLSSQVYFEKSLDKVPETEKPTTIQSFLDSVPLVSVSSKIFRQQNKETLIAINRNFYEAVKLSFSTLGFAITAVVPELVLGESASQFSADTCRLIFKKMDFLLQNSFLREDESQGFQHKEQQFLKRHQVLVVMLFLLAVIFAGVMVFIRLGQIKKPRPRPQVIAPTLAPRPKIPPSPTPEASPSANLVTLSAQILNASGKTGAASKLQTGLTSLGLPTVKIGNSAPASGSSIGFSPRVWPQSRRVISDVVARLFPTTLFSEASPSGGFDVVIIVGKLTP